eukprot:957274_1
MSFIIHCHQIGILRTLFKHHDCKTLLLNVKQNPIHNEQKHMDVVSAVDLADIYGYSVLKQLIQTYCNEVVEEKETDELQSDHENVDVLRMELMELKREIERLKETDVPQSDHENMDVLRTELMDVKRENERLKRENERLKYTKQTKDPEQQPDSGSDHLF